MRLKLPIPIFMNGNVYNEMETRRPTPGVLADTKKTAQTGDYYSAISTLIWGCCECVFNQDGNEITDKVGLKSLLRHLPYKTAEYIAIMVMVSLDPTDDGIEGVYSCPLCGHNIVCECIMEDGQIVIDTRDFIHNLKIKFQDVPQENFIYNFTEEVVIKNAVTGEPLETIRDIMIKHPTLVHCTTAFQKYGKRDEMRTQFGIYSEALIAVNGYEIDNSWRSRFGMLMFENIPNTKIDLIGITRKINEFGIDKRVEKECPSCGKKFRQIVNTSNFFAFEVEPM